MVGINSKDGRHESKSSHSDEMSVESLENDVFIKVTPRLNSPTRQSLKPPAPHQRSYSENDAFELEKQETRQPLNRSCHGSIFKGHDSARNELAVVSSGMIGHYSPRHESDRRSVSMKQDTCEKSDELVDDLHLDSSAGSCSLYSMKSSEGPMSARSIDSGRSKRAREASRSNLALDIPAYSLELEDMSRPTSPSSRSGTPGTPGSTISGTKSPRSPIFAAMGFKPVMPGYKKAQTPRNDRPSRQRAKSVVIERTVSIQQRPERQSSTIDLIETMDTLTDIIPIMPHGLAVVCFVCNVLCPGLGTIIGGFSVLCGAKRRSGSTNGKVIWLSFWIGVLQFVLVPLMLLGLVWSYRWGKQMIKVAEEYDDAEDDEDDDSEEEDEHRNPAAHRFNQRYSEGAPTMVRSTTRVSLPDGESPHNGSSRPISSSSAAPIIVLQEAPVFIREQPDIRNELPGLQKRPNNVRRERMMRRQQGPVIYEEDLPSVLLDPQALENFIIRDGAPPGAV